MNEHNTTTSNSERRSKPRFSDPPARCNIGRILDLSANGMRIKVATRRGLSPGDTVSVVLNGMEIKTRVAWVNKGFSKSTIGVTIETATPELRRLLTSIVVESVSGPRLAEVNNYVA